MKKHLIVLGILVFLASCQFFSEKKIEEKSSVAEEILQGNSIARSVVNNVLTSDALPEIKIKVDEEFKFIGKFE